MKNRSNKSNKTKFIARVMLVVLLSATMMSFLGCFCSSDINKNKRLNLNNGQINFLCIRDMKNEYPNYSIKTQDWYFDGGMNIKDGKEEYCRPYLNYQTVVYSEELGDDRSLFEKWSNKSGSNKHSFTLSAQFFGFQGDIKELQYDFSLIDLEENFIGKIVSISNDGEMIGKVFCRSKLNISDEYLSELLSNSLVTISVDKYAIVTKQINGIQDLDVSIPDLNKSALCYLGIRDLRNDDDCKELINYCSEFHNGYDYQFWYGFYYNAENILEISYFSESLESEVKICAEFYEYRGEIGDVEYMFVADEYGKNHIELFCHENLIGNISYESQAVISEDWLIEFLNNNLVTIHVKKVGGNYES